MAFLPAQIIRIAFNLVTENISTFQLFDGFERQQMVYSLFASSLLLFGTLVLVLALLRGIFVFFYAANHYFNVAPILSFDMKNEIYAHYQALSLAFFSAGIIPAT